MKKVLKFALLCLISACGTESEEDRLLDEMNRHSRDLIESCLDTKHKALCSSRVVTAKILDPEEEKYWNSICWTEIDLTSKNREEKLFVAISATYLNMGDRKLLVHSKIYECLVWRQGGSGLSFSEFALDLNLQTGS
jgi:sensor c-di-GMP phosphodiesterase-like protein